MSNAKKTKVATNDTDLFNNPMTRAAMSALSDDELIRYKEIGEELYGSIDFEAAKVLNNMPPPMAEACAYVSTGLDSGLHPSDMDENEKAVMEDAYGKEWYMKWGYAAWELDSLTPPTAK